MRERLRDRERDSEKEERLSDREREIVRKRRERLRDRERERKRRERTKKRYVYMTKILMMRVITRIKILWFTFYCRIT